MSKNDKPVFRRLQSSKLQQLAQSFPIVCLIGPRQSGKTTLARTSFPDYTYLSLEDLDNRTYAENDPRGFLADYANKVILDEVQRTPDLLSYLQTQVDKTDSPGQYILTGSAQLTLLEKLTQSLAGRTALLKLLPLSLTELNNENAVKQDCCEQLFYGFYPRIYKHDINPIDWYPNYTQTYIEKDVRDIINITSLTTFKRFIALCAGRHGQLLDISALANDCGIARKTATNWLSILEASFLIYRLSPFHNNFNKRLIKSPKLYFYDSGLVCSLLKIETPEQLKTHYLKGAIFEGFVITEIMKQRHNLGLEPHIYFWRDKNGNEIDCIVEQENQLLSVEIKSGKTLNQDFFKGLSYWQNLSGQTPKNSFLIYAGDERQSRSSANVLPWHDVNDILSES